MGGCGKKLEVVGKIFVWVQNIWLGANVQKILRTEMSRKSSSSMDFLRPLMIFLFTWRSNHLLPFLKDITSDRVQLKKLNYKFVILNGFLDDIFF